MSYSYGYIPRASFYQDGAENRDAINDLDSATTAGVEVPKNLNGENLFVVVQKNDAFTGRIYGLIDSGSEQDWVLLGTMTWVEPYHQGGYLTLPVRIKRVQMSIGSITGYANVFFGFTE